jgi:hypothetical protein
MVLNPLWNVSEVIVALGGPSKIARMTGRSPQAVCNWRQGTVPPKYEKMLSAALEAKGFYATPAVFGFIGDFRKSG